MGESIYNRDVGHKHRIWLIAGGGALLVCLVAFSVWRDTVTYGQSALTLQQLMMIQMQLRSDHAGQYGLTDYNQELIQRDTTGKLGRCDDGRLCHLFGGPVLVVGQGDQVELTLVGVPLKPCRTLAEHGLGKLLQGLSINGTSIDPAKPSALCKGPDNRLSGHFR